MSRSNQGMSYVEIGVILGVVGMLGAVAVGGILADKAYKRIRRVFDPEYRVQDKVRRTRNALLQAEVASPTKTISDSRVRYESALVNAVTLYSKREDEESAGWYRERLTELQQGRRDRFWGIPNW